MPHLRKDMLGLQVGYGSFLCLFVEPNGLKKRSESFCLKNPRDKLPTAKTFHLTRQLVQTIILANVKILNLYSSQ